MPDVPLPASGTVDPLGIAHVQGFEHLLQAFFHRRYHDKVDVIGHEAIGEDV